MRGLSKRYGASEARRRPGTAASSSQRLRRKRPPRPPSVRWRSRSASWPWISKRSAVAARSGAAVAYNRRSSSSSPAVVVAERDRSRGIRTRPRGGGFSAPGHGQPAARATGSQRGQRKRPRAGLGMPAANPPPQWIFRTTAATVSIRPTRPRSHVWTAASRSRFTCRRKTAARRNRRPTYSPSFAG